MYIEHNMKGVEIFYKLNFYLHELLTWFFNSFQENILLLEIDLYEIS
jgi:hypothetical protein